MTQYALANHVFVCLSGKQLVLLDVKEDRYWALEAASTSGLDSWIKGWPVGSPLRPPRSMPTGQEEAALGMLLDRGLVVRHPSGGKDATPVSVESPAGELSGESDAGTRVRSPSLHAFLAASLTARWMLRFRRFDRVIARVARRKARRPCAPVPELEIARELVPTFTRFRVLLFSTKNECLRDSLSMLEFLARRACFPDWVFGVQTKPFAAHCWIQLDGLVLNDTAEHVRGYTPIMIV